MALETRAGVKTVKSVGDASRCKGDVLASLPLVRVKCLNEFDYTDRVWESPPTFSVTTTQLAFIE